MTSCGERSSELRSQQLKFKEPVSLMRDDNKRPDGTTVLPWATEKEKPMAWDVTVPDTYAESHIGSTAAKPGAAANKRAQNKIDKYAKLASTHIFSEAELTFTFAIRYRQSVCRLLSVICLKRSCALLRPFKFSAIFLWHYVPWPSTDIH